MDENLKVALMSSAAKLHEAVDILAAANVKYEAWPPGHLSARPRSSSLLIKEVEINNIAKKLEEFIEEDGCRRED